AMVKETHKFAQSRASKSDMRKNLAEKELREENLITRNAVMDTRKAVHEGFQNLNHIQPTLEDVRLAVGNLESTQPKLDDFTAAVDKSVSQLPTLSQVEDVVRNALDVDAFRKMIEDVVAKQQMFVPINMAPSASDEEVAELKKKVDDALRAQSHSDHRADEEFRSKMHWQEKAIELEAKLKLAEEEAARQKEIAEEKDAHLKAVEEKRHQ